MERHSIITKTAFLIFVALASNSIQAFVVSPNTVSKADATQLNALFQTGDFLADESALESTPTTGTVDLVSRTQRQERDSTLDLSRRSSFWTAAAAALLVAVAALPQASLAVSGGGLDFAGLDISNQDFSNQNYKGKDFTQVLARNTNFSGSNLAGCRFPKAYLINANYEGADIRGVSFEGTNLENANLKNAVASGAYFGATIIDAASVENVDFTDAQFPPKTLALMCDRPDMKGTNPTTGVDTRDSAMCP